MNDLLKSAIADAKAIKDTAMQNAKATLEESIFYKVSPLLESKDEEEEEDKKEVEEGEQPPWLKKKQGHKEGPKMESKETDEEDENMKEAYDEEGEDGEEKDDQNESASLEEILAELEEELKSSNIGAGDNKVDNYDSDTEDPQGPKYFSRKDVMSALESMFSEAIGDKEGDDEEEEGEKKDMNKWKTN